MIAHSHTSSSPLGGRKPIIGRGRKRKPEKKKRKKGTPIAPREPSSLSDTRGALQERGKKEEIIRGEKKERRGWLNGSPLPSNPPLPRRTTHGREKIEN